MFNVKANGTYIQLAGLALLFLVVIFLDFYSSGFKDNAVNQNDQVIPAAGTVLPVKWGNLGVKMTIAGVIDAEKFKNLYRINGQLDGEMEKLINGTGNGKIKITPLNSALILNLFWALGLGNKNKILETGPMTDSKYGGDSGRFASTGGWKLARGNAMDHYSKHLFIALTPEQQTLVEKVSKNVYRPCCDNPTYFPDCNHGMAMLGLLELTASQGASEKEMHRIALAVNSYWFPDAYLTVEKYLKEKKNIDWKDADPKEILGPNYSSASGYQRILTQVVPPVNNNSQGCGV